MLTHGRNVFAPDTPIDDCARLAALFEALFEGRVRIPKPRVQLMLYPGFPPLAVVMCCQ